MSRHPAMHRARGFTLLELVVAGTVSLLIFSAAAEIMIQAAHTRIITARRATLMQDAQLVMGWLRRDTYAAGNGAMTATDRMGTTGYDSMAPFVVATDAARTSATVPAFGSGGTLSPASATTGFTLIGDVPRPDSLVDGIAGLGDLPHTATSLIPTNEFSGRRFDTTTTRPGSVTGTSACTSNDPMSANAMGCPWAFGKWRTTAGLNIIQVIHPDRSWENTTISGMTAPGATHTLTVATLASTNFNSPFAAAMMTQVDRIGYLFDTATKGVYRRQCWAQPVAGADVAVGFPLALTGNANGCDGTNSTGWMQIARDLDLAGTTITMRNGAGAATTNPAEVMAIDVNLVLSRNVQVGSTAARVKNLKVNLRERFIMRTRSG